MQLIKQDEEVRRIVDQLHYGYQCNLSILQLYEVDG